MPKATDIEGGRPTGKPRNWDPATHGDCAALSVLYRTDEDSGLPVMVSAWDFTPAERQALERGGHLFLQIFGEQHPVVALWTQDAAGNAIALDAPAEPEAPQLLRDGVITINFQARNQLGMTADPGAALSWALGAAATELDRQAEGATEVGEIDDAGLVFVHGMVDLKAVVEAALEATGHRAAPAEVTYLPLHTLGSLGAEAQVRRALTPTPAASNRKCRECGCTQTNACTSTLHGACWWIYPDLCSHCAIGPVDNDIITHPETRAANGAKCPAPKCHHENPVPAEGLSYEWQSIECGGCKRSLEFRAYTTGGDPAEGGYEIACRRAAGGPGAAE